MKLKSRSSLWIVTLAPLTAQVLSASSHSSPRTGSLPPSTCESRTLNYVTHTLPQQCFSTTRPYNSNATSISTPSHGSTVHNVEAFITNNVLPSSSIVSSAPPEATAKESGEPQSDVDFPSETITETPTEARATQSTEASISTSASSADPEADSPLDNAKFLSFEEWRKQHLADNGQTAEPANQGPYKPHERRSRPGINNALDGLGEDTEIEIDFGGFAAGSPEYTARIGSRAAGANPTEIQNSVSDSNAEAPSRPRNKDAGRTCKERFNYASFDCAANVLKTNPQCKSVSSILVENKDSYMLTECSAENKFFIVELCNVVQIDTIVLANFEFFSSMFRTFRVSVSDRYPVKLDKWREIATYEAKNTREIQAFLVEDPVIYARYLRIEILTHYGSEYYCPVSLLRVHGRTMMEEYMDEYRREQRRARGESEMEDEEGEDETAPAQPMNPSPGLPKPSPPEDLLGPTVEEPKSDNPQQPSTSVAASVESEKVTDAKDYPPADQISKSATVGDAPSSTSETKTRTSSIVPPTSTPSELSFLDLYANLSTCSAEWTNYTQPDAQSSSSPAANSDSRSQQVTPRETSSGTVHSPIVATPIQQVAHPSAAPPVPITQESFFKSIHKRLQALEANSTLSLQYIESQSQLLRDAFAKVEKRNIARASDFLATLNDTVIAELARFKGEYEQLWQSTVLELASQRDEGRAERELLGDRIRVLAEEMVAQRRLMIIEATLLLVCLGLVLFGKSGSHIDGGLVQSVQELVRRGRRKDRLVNGVSGFATTVMPWESPWGSPTRGHLSTRSAETLPLHVVSDDEARDPNTPGSANEELPPAASAAIRQRRAFLDADEDSEDTIGTADAAEISSPEMRRTTTAPAA